MREAKALTRLRIYAVLSQRSLLADAIHVNIEVPCSGASAHFMKLPLQLDYHTKLHRDCGNNSMFSAICWFILSDGMFFTNFSSSLHQFYQELYRFDR